MEQTTPPKKKRNLAIAAGIALLGGVIATPLVLRAQAQSPDLSTENAKVAYSFGYLMGKSNQEVIKNMDLKTFQDGFKTGYTNKKPAISEENMQKLLLSFRDKRQQEMQNEQVKKATDNQKAGEKYLTDNSKKPGIVTLPSGLQYQVLKEGTGETPKPTDKVKVNYEGRLLDGTVFDSSIARNEPVTFPLNQVIPGWTEGLQHVKTGGKIRLFIPAKLGYGDSGSGPIPPNSTLIFDVDLLGVNPRDDAPAAPK